MASEVLTFPAGEQAAPIVTYSVTDAIIAGLREKCAGLTADTTEGYEAVRVAIGHLRDSRGAIERRRVELKADALAWGRTVDSEAKRLTAALEAIEDPLKVAKKAVDDEEARIRAEKEAAKVAALQAEIRANQERQEAERKAARDAEEARIAADRAELEREKAKLAEERRAADERAATERARVDAEQRAERERLRIERERIEADRRAVAAAREKAEREEFERKAKATAEREAAEKAERDRIAAEQARIAEAERQAAAAARLDALRPDVEKVTAFAAAIMALQPPDVTTPEARVWLETATTQLRHAADYLCYQATSF